MRSSLRVWVIVLGAFVGTFGASIVSVNALPIESGYLRDFRDSYPYFGVRSLDVVGPDARLFAVKSSGQIAESTWASGQNVARNQFGYLNLGVDGVISTPEPPTLLLLGFGVAGFASVVRRRRRMSHVK